MHTAVRAVRPGEPTVARSSAPRWPRPLRPDPCCWHVSAPCWPRPLRPDPCCWHVRGIVLSGHLLWLLSLFGVFLSVGCVQSPCHPRPVLRPQLTQHRQVTPTGPPRGLLGPVADCPLACPAPVRCRRLWVLRGLEPGASGDSATAEVPASHAGSPPAYCPTRSRSTGSHCPQVLVWSRSGFQVCLRACPRKPDSQLHGPLSWFICCSSETSRNWPERAAGVSSVVCRELICKCRVSLNESDPRMHTRRAFVHVCAWVCARGSGREGGHSCLERGAGLCQSSCPPESATRNSGLGLSQDGRYVSALGVASGRLRCCHTVVSP